MSHTPGPWKYNEAGSMVLANNDQMNIADIRGFGFLSTFKTESEVIATMDANGRLIAAAPELLEALKELVEHASNLGRNAKLYERAEELIKKIEG